MEINHFSHPKHPLILVADGEPDQWKDSRPDLVCNGCHEPVIITTPSPSGYYRCGSGCEFTLHKRCAELPRRINYPRHPKHPLVLYSYPRHPKYPIVLSSIPSIFINFTCNVCGRGGWKWFTYHCLRCEYNVDAVCALAHLEFQELLVRTKEMRVYDNSEIHHHPLTLHLKPAKFRCDFCNTEARDFSYICTDRDCASEQAFSIHKRCAHAPPTLHLIHTHPDHPLRLSPSLPEMYHLWTFPCDICKKFMVRDHRLYYCRNCRFFSHVKCAFEALDHPPSGCQRDDLEEEDKEVIDPNDPFMKLPFEDSEAMTDALSLYFKDSTTVMSTLLPHEDDDNTEFMKHHWSHTDDHPLALIVKAPSDNNVANIVSDDPITVCDGCVRPITIPYYFCGPCDFYLHQHCAKLPLTLFNHILHPNHPLELKCKRDHVKAIQCKGCFHYCNKFFYKCHACRFYLDVNCAFLPQRIKHEKHKHPLLQCLVFEEQISDVCGYLIYGIAFRCDKANCSFLISLFQAMLPRCIQHRYDKKHPILLTYPPVKDHPQEFFCELCETEIHPKYWMYHCGPCAFSFHTDCLYRQDLLSNVKWETITHTSSKHRHGPLSYTRRKKNSKKFLCSLCNLDINGRLILECNQCKFQICANCDDKPKIPYSPAREFIENLLMR